MASRGRLIGREFTIEKAIRALWDALNGWRIETERVRVPDALDRILAQDVVAPADFPPFDRAAMDGYAVKAEDTFGASPTNPALLRVVGESRIGQWPDFEVHRGEAAYVDTGAPIPKGADAVVMAEYANRVSEEFVEVLSPVAVGENVSKRGEDVKAGSIALKRGAVVGPAELGLIHQLGLEEVEVFAKPKVAVFSVGDELVELFPDAPPGKIVDSNTPMISSVLRRWGADPVASEPVPDDVDAVKEALRRSLESCDAAVVCGGTSVGEKDVVPEAVDSLGPPGVVVRGLAIRPGRPTGLAVVVGKPVFLVPGFPAAAYLVTEFVVIRFLWMAMGHQDGPPRRTALARLSRKVPSHPGVTHFVRVSLRREGDELYADPITASGAGVLSSIIRADGVVVVPPELEGYEAGERVWVYLM